MSIKPDNCINGPSNPIVQLRSCGFVRITDAFFSSPLYFLLIGFLTVIANVFSAELFVYSCFVVMGVYISFFGRDYLPIIPLVVLCYIAPSQVNNPGSSQGSIFYPENGGILILILAAVFAVSVLVRLALDPEIGGAAFWRAKRSLLPGIAVLGIAYLLAGVGSGHYFDRGFSNLLFAALQFLSLALMYCFFTGAVKWSEAPEDYLAKSGLCIGFVLLAEIINIYLTQPVIADGTILRIAIYTGWGNYNNIGALLTMMLPFAFSLATVKKHGWIYHLCGIVLLFGVIMTCSRASILCAALIYVICAGITLWKAKSRRGNLITILVALGTALAGLLLFREQILHLFHIMLSHGFQSVDRIEGYTAGIAQFLQHPVFGGTFYPLYTDLYTWSTVENFSAFFPPRWHNTLIQLAASCGIAGLASYAFHRIQTLHLIIKKSTVTNLFIAISLLALLGTSLLDCHFFNIGPTLFYSIALAFAEKHRSKA